jgi:hypothetical protein
MLQSSFAYFSINFTTFPGVGVLIENKNNSSNIRYEVIERNPPPSGAWISTCNGTHDSLVGDE